MTANINLLVTQLHEILKNSLDFELYQNGVFFGERLLCEVDNEDVRYLLAKCYQGN